MGFVLMNTDGAVTNSYKKVTKWLQFGYKVVTNGYKMVTFCPKSYKKVTKNAKKLQKNDKKASKWLQIVNFFTIF